MKKFLIEVETELSLYHIVNMLCDNDMEADDIKSNIRELRLTAIVENPE